MCACIPAGMRRSALAGTPAGWWSSGMTQRAAGVTRSDGPVTPLELLSPRALREDEVLIDVRAAGVGDWDELMRAGEWPSGLRPPHALGVEAAGVVGAVGRPDLESWLGRPVLTHIYPFRAGAAWAEHLIAPAGWVAKSRRRWAGRRRPCSLCRRSRRCKRGRAGEHRGQHRGQHGVRARRGRSDGRTGSPPHLSVPVREWWRQRAAAHRAWSPPEYPRSSTGGTASGAERCGPRQTSPFGSRSTRRPAARPRCEI